MFSLLRPVCNASLLVLLVFLVLPSASVVVVAQPHDDDHTTTNSSSLLLRNYNALREEGHGFFLQELPILYEKPGSVTVSPVLVSWWCDFEFSSSEDADTIINYGYVGRAVGYFLGASLEDIVALGAQISSTTKDAYLVSAVLVSTLGIFEGQYHNTQDDEVLRYWDNGSARLPNLGWEGHDEGDTSQNSDTSAWSVSGAFTKITTEEAAKYLGMDVADMTPATCSTEYTAAWNATHVPDPIATSVIALKETVAQLQVDNKELLSRINAIEGSLPANGSSSSGDDRKATATSSSSPFMAALEHATTDIVMKAFLTVAVSIGLVLFW